MRNTYVKDPGGWAYTQKNSEAGPGGGFPKDPGTLGHTQDPGGM